MIKVLRVICISLKAPVKKLLFFISFIATWAAFFYVTSALLALLFDSTWNEAATSWVGMLAGIFCVGFAVKAFHYFSKIKKNH